MIAIHPVVRHQAMTYEQREALKWAACHDPPERGRSLLLENAPTQQVARTFEELSDDAARCVLITLAHWHRQKKCGRFEDYVPHWIDAQAGLLVEDAAVLKELRGHWPAPAVSRIRRGESYFE